MERTVMWSQLPGSNTREKSHACCMNKQSLDTLGEALGGGEWLRVEGLDVLASGAFCCSLLTQGETAFMVRGPFWPWVLRLNRGPSKRRGKVCLSSLPNAISLAALRSPSLKDTSHFGARLERAVEHAHGAWSSIVYVHECWRLWVPASDQPVPVSWRTPSAGIFKARIRILRALVLLCRKFWILFYKICRVSLQGFHYSKTNKQTRNMCNKYLIISLPKIDSSEPFKPKLLFHVIRSRLNIFIIFSKVLSFATNCVSLSSVFLPFSGSKLFLGSSPEFKAGYMF